MLRTPDFDTVVHSTFAMLLSGEVVLLHRSSKKSFFFFHSIHQTYIAVIVNQNISFVEVFSNNVTSTTSTFISSKNEIEVVGKNNKHHSRELLEPFGSLTYGRTKTKGL